MADIFISYAQQDRERVRRLVEALRAEGFELWWDALIEPGVSWEAAIDRELEAAKAVVVVWSEQSVDRLGSVCNEARYAERMGKLCTLHIDQVSPPTFFQHLHSENLVGWTGDRAHPGFRKVLARVSALARSADPEADPALLALGERLTRLENLTWGYGRRINGFLDWLERRVDGGHPPGRGLWLRSFTPGLLNLTLLLAVAYPIFSLALQWAATGEESALGRFIALGPTNAFSWERGAVFLLAALIAFSAMLQTSRAKLYRGEHARHDGRPEVLAGFLAIAAAGTGAAAVAEYVPVAFALTFAVAFMVAIASAISFAGAGVAAISVAVAVALTVAAAFDLAASLGSENVVASAALVAVFVGAATAVSLAFAAVQDAIGRAIGAPGAALLVLLCILALAAVAVLSGWALPNWSGVFQIPVDRAHIILFLAFLPFINAIFDFCSIGLTRYLLRKGATNVSWRTLDYAALDLVLGALLFLGLGCASIAAIHFLRAADGRPLLDLQELFTDIALRPQAYWWLYATYFSTLLPTVCHVVIVGAAFMDIFVRGASEKAKRALLIAEPADLDAALRSAAIRTWVAQGFGLIVGAAFSAGLVYVLAFGWGSAIAGAMFDLFILFARTIGALPPDFARPV